ncbi:CAP domain-containing protein [Pelagibacterium xiamenense]|uniref:CAP domain-containing protein n=1 Tax=Pelagibacterium xiamenense TaxID=2901140 RepID=UPI001E51F0FA|nr:CAP domain-containing protein [Pelagibacterium xiamenense]MCD7061337.1 CAP domain-containing protein [Pelagibacterium xiamenense]
MTFASLSFRPALLTAAALLVVALAACSPGGTTIGLPQGLTATIDRPGAQMDRAAALNILNQYRATRGAQPLAGDATLDAQAQAVAQAYASSGTPPATPEGVTVMRLSAGYLNFAETFSGWRSSPPDADALAAPSARRAGLAVVYDPNSAYGAHWVVLLAS